MAVTLTHRNGEMTQFSDEEELDGLITELDQPSDAEHPDVSISQASGLALSAFKSGRVAMENVESDIAPMHQLGSAATKSGRCTNSSLVARLQRFPRSIGNRLRNLSLPLIGHVARYLMSGHAMPY